MPYNEPPITRRNYIAEAQPARELASGILNAKVPDLNAGRRAQYTQEQQQTLNAQNIEQNKWTLAELEAKYEKAKTDKAALEELKKASAQNWQQKLADTPDKVAKVQQAIMGARDLPTLENMNVNLDQIKKLNDMVKERFGDKIKTTIDADPILLGAKGYWEDYKARLEQQGNHLDTSGLQEILQSSIPEYQKTLNAGTPGNAQDFSKYVIGKEQSPYVKEKFIKDKLAESFYQSQQDIELGKARATQANKPPAGTQQKPVNAGINLADNKARQSHSRALLKKDNSVDGFIEALADEEIWIEVGKSDNVYNAPPLEAEKAANMEYKKLAADPQKGKQARIKQLNEDYKKAPDKAGFFSWLLSQLPGGSSSPAPAPQQAPAGTQTPTGW
jgi:hypothetical protein